MTIPTRDRRLVRLLYALAMLTEIVLVLPGCYLLALAVLDIADVHTLPVPGALPESTVLLAAIGAGGVLAGLALCAGLQELACRIEVRHWTPPASEHEAVS